MFDAKVFGERLIGLRHEMRLSIEDAAERIGINQLTLRKYEGNASEYRIDPEVLSKIAAFYGCSIDFLFGMTNTPEALYFMQIDEVIEKSYEKYIAFSRANAAQIETDDSKVISPYPYNLLEEVFGERFEEVPVPLNDYQKKFIFEKIAELKERERKCVESYFIHGKTLLEIGNELGVGKERVRQILRKAYRKLRSRASLGEITRWAYPEEYNRLLSLRKEAQAIKEETEVLINSYADNRDLRMRVKETIEQHFAEKDEEQTIDIPCTPKLPDLNFSVRTFNALVRTFNGSWKLKKGREWIDNPYHKPNSTWEDITLDDIYKLYSSGDIWYVRNMGRKSIEEVERELVKYGYLKNEEAI